MPEELTYRQVSFTIRLQCGSRYDHWTTVPSNIVDPHEVEKYILLTMFNNKIYIDIDEDEPISRGD
jgi:hypothetical protein